MTKPDSGEEVKVVPVVAIVAIGIVVVLALAGKPIWRFLRDIFERNPSGE